VVVVDLRRPARPIEGAGAAELRAEAVARRPGAADPATRERGFAIKEAGFDRQLARAIQETTAQEAQPPLWRALQERVIPQIVQRTGIILRDGGEGEIRLVLKPEHLGAVRVRLHLGESSLEGRIVVDNNIVKELLEANLEHLKNALRQEGFASPNIEVSVGGGRSEGRAPADGEPAGGPLPAVPGQQVREFERGAPLAWEAGLGYSTVNIWI
jgi:flagellar hook-length control protein FliK